jgi:hypothetical protein
MKSVLIGLGAVLLFSGCFETHFNFKTVVHPNGQMDRETHIDGRGANRFQAPSGPAWKVEASQSKGGQTILEDTHYHIHATGRFQNPNEFSSDFRYDVSKLIANLTPETRKEYLDEIGIPEPLEESIRASNEVRWRRRNLLFNSQYEYSEIIHMRWIIPILMHDLKKEIIRQETAAIEPEAPLPPEAGAEAQAPVIAPALLSPEKIEALARKKLREEILPQFRFHCEITLPGKIAGSNASQIRGRTAVWDFRASDFGKNFSAFEIEVTSRAPNVWVISGASLAVIAVIWFFALSKRQGRTRKRVPAGSAR